MKSFYVFVLVFEMSFLSHVLLHHILVYDPLADVYSSVQSITTRGGRFLEAPVAGSQQLSNDGMLVILAAGDRSVYEDCSSCFQAMGKSSFFLGTLVFLKGAYYTHRCECD